MSTVDSSSQAKATLNASSSVSSNSECQLPNNNIPFYKKEKQILLEFDQIVRGRSFSELAVDLFPSLADIRVQLNEQVKCLEQRLDTQRAIVIEIREYFQRRAEVELEYAKSLDNLQKQIGQRHRTQKARRETWLSQSLTKLWDTIVQDTQTHVKYHTILADVCGKHIVEKFNEIADDTRRMFLKVNNLLFSWTRCLECLLVRIRRFRQP